MVAALNTTSQDDHWALRRWGLALLGGLAGLAIHHILKTDQEWRWSEDTGRVALATFIGGASICFGFVVERGKLAGSAIFALVAALVVASVFYWSGDFRSWEPWRLVSALLAVAIAAPLFQAWRDGGERRWHIPYVATHDRAWTNVCLWFASWGFVGVTFLLALLLAALFDLIGIDLLKELLRRNWFNATLAGAAFGGAVGLLRDRERIVSTLQRIVMTVLSVLAPVLAIGLVLFLAALPFTGLGALWETTKATTPILLSCVIGALILANSVIGDRPEDESSQRIMRWSAMALGATLLPLAVIAAISTGLRIEQYGLTPSRLWAVTFTAIACAYGLAYLVALVRGRGKAWSHIIRPANMRLAVGLCGLALLLSTPLISFGAISTRDQLARLTSGKIPVEEFDFAALRFDFGPAGMKALEKLEKEGKTKDIRASAAQALKFDNRYAAREKANQTKAHHNIVIFPQTAKLPVELREKLTADSACRWENPCNVIYDPQQGEALVTRRDTVQIFVLEKGKWEDKERPVSSGNTEAMKRMNSAFAQGKVEIREVNRRQVFIDGQPVGQSFE